MMGSEQLMHALQRPQPVRPKRSRYAKDYSPWL